MGYGWLLTIVMAVIVVWLLSGLQEGLDLKSENSKGRCCCTYCFPGPGGGCSYEWKDTDKCFGLDTSCGLDEWCKKEALK